MKTTGPLLVLAVSLLSVLVGGCFGSPTPLAPGLRGSVGVPHKGVLTGAAALERKGDGYVRLRDDGAHFGNPRLVKAIEHAAREVERQRPGGAPLVVGDLSLEHGGYKEGHRSHRSGRDADLLLYALTADGRSVRSPGFARFGRDGLAQSGNRFYRLDVERQWLLVKALITSPEAHIQWLFVARWLEALVVEYARARGEEPELVWYASNVLRQPGDGLPHDDHVHVRLGCTLEEAVAGCDGGGPRWPWFPELQVFQATDEELLRALLEDLPGATRVGAPSP